MKTNQWYTPTHRVIGDNMSGIIFYIMGICFTYFGNPEENYITRNIICNYNNWYYDIP